MLLRTWDIESEDWNKFKIASIYDGRNIYLCYSPRQIVDKMVELKGTFYAHFGGGFDNLFLLETLKEYDIKIQNIKSRLVKISVYYKKSKKKLFELRDSFPILTASLENLRKSFDIKLPITDEKFREYKSRRNDIKNFTEKELIEYVSVDTVVLYNILVEAEKVFKRKDFKLTIASESMARFQEIYPYYKNLCMPASLDNYFRKAYSGGRVEVFKRYGENLNHYDFKSMYPKVMRKEYYPSGTAIFTTKLHTDKMGIYTAEVEAPKIDIPFLHAYSDDGKLCFPVGKWQATYTSVELTKAQQLGYKVRIIDGYYFTDRVRPFLKYVDHFYDLKATAEKEGKKALRYIAKLYLNSLYGKFGQRRIFDKLIRIEGSLRDMKEKYGEFKDVIPEINSIIIEDETKKPYTTVQIACFVTAYARIELFNAITNAQIKGGDVYYCDTDCVITDTSLTTGHALGDLELEAEIKEGWFLFPKFYGYEKLDGKSVIRTKGLGAGNFKLADFKKAYELEQFGLFSEVRTAIVGVMEGHRRHLNYLEVIERKRKISGSFDKRKISDDKINTEPISLN